MAPIANTGADPTGVTKPTAGGGFRGLGERFSPDLNTGTGNFSVPLFSPRGPNHFAPELILGYSTAAGNGPFGLGWSFGIPRIHRESDHGVPTYEDARDRLLLAGEELVEIEPGVFRHRREDQFLRAVRQGDGWVVNERSGVTMRLGNSAASRETVSIGGVEAVYSWCLEETRDPHGNAIGYRYQRHGGHLLLTEVRYGGWRVVLDYEARPDVVFSARRGAESNLALRCREIRYFATDLGSDPVRRYRLRYRDSGGVSLLETVTMTGRSPGRAAVSAPPLSFSYTGFEPEKRRFRSMAAAGGAEPPPLDRRHVALADVVGDGLPDVVQLAGTGSRWWQNLGEAGFAAPRSLPNLPTPIRLGQAGVALADMTGSTTADVIDLTQRPFGLHPHEPGHGWGGRHAFRGRPPFDLGDPKVRLVDLDGDGRVDVLRAGERRFQLYFNRFGTPADGGSDNDWSAAFSVPRIRDRERFPDLDFTDPAVRFADMTGDGLNDIIHLRGGRIDYWPYLGRGRWHSRRTLVLPDVPVRRFDPQRFFVYDVDGDGVADFVYVGLDRVHLWRNLGGGGVGSRRDVYFTPSTVGASIRIADMEGDGTAGVLWTFPRTRARPSTYRFLSFTGGTKPYLLSAVDFNTGKRTEIDYRSSVVDAGRDRRRRRPWTTSLPFPLAVVAEIREVDSLADVTRRRQFRYRDGRWDTAERRFSGFGEVETVEPGDASIEGLRTVTFFEQGVGRPRRDTAALARRPKRVAVYARPVAEERPERLLRTEDSRFEVVPVALGLDGSAILHGRLNQAVEVDFEDGAEARRKTTDLAWDDHGNVVRKCETIRCGADRTNVVTEVAYAIDLARWILDRPRQIIKADNTGEVLALQRFFYDGPAFEGLPAGQVERGKVSREQALILTPATVTAAYGASVPDLESLGYRRMVLPNGERGWGIDAVKRAFDVHGNVTHTRDALGAEARLSFDAEGVFPIESRNALGHVTTMVYDPLAEKPARQQDPNGAVVESHFDALGRLVAQIRPGDTEALPTVSLEYLDDALPLGVRSRTRISSGAPATLSKTEYFDGEGRALQERTQVDGDAVLVAPGQGVNVRGEPHFRPIPFASTGLGYVADEPGSPGATALRYDALARLVEARAPDGGITRVAYRSGARDRFAPDDPRGRRPTTERFDPLGRLTEIIERGAGGHVRRTRYAYDRCGNLRSITDPRGVEVAAYVRDLEGRILHATHVDAGVSVCVYDAAARRVERRGGDDVVVAVDHDALGRVTAVKVDGETVERFSYDGGPGDNLLMRLARIEDELGITELSYDRRGRHIERTVTAPEGTFQFRFAYDAVDRPTAVEYPNGEEVRYLYAGTRLRSIPGVIDQVDYAPQGQLGEIRYANGARQRFHHDPASLRVAGLELRIPGRSDAELTRSYAYDALGFPRSVTDEGGEVQTFAYDDFGQLVGTAGRQGTSVMDEVFSWDDAGNPTRNPALGDGDLTYRPGTNQLEGRRVGGVTERLFDHDPSGRLTRLPGRRLSWDGRGRLQGAETNAGVRLELEYGHDGRRVRTRTLRGTVEHTRITPQGDYEVADGAAAIWVGINGQPVAWLEAGGKKRFLHADYRGDVLAITDETGAVVGRRTYRPFGGGAALSGEDAALGFLGAAGESELGLVQLGSRWYDPQLRRFLTPDLYLLFEPERVLSSPGMLNLYVYSGNNPMVLHDLTGRRPDWWHWLVGGLVIAALIVATVVVGVFTGGAGFAFGVLLFASIGAVMGSAAGVATAYYAGGDLGKGFLFGALVGGAAGALSYAAAAGVTAALGTSFWGQALAGAAMGAIQTAGTGAIWGYAGGTGTVEDVLINAAIGFGVGAVAGFVAGAGASWMTITPGVQTGVSATTNFLGVSSAFNSSLVTGVLIGAITYPAYLALANQRGDVSGSEATASTISELRSSSAQQALVLQPATPNLLPEAGLGAGAAASQSQALYYPGVTGADVDPSIVSGGQRLDRVVREALGD